MSVHNSKMDILGVKINITNLRLATEVIEGWVKERKKTYVCVVPVSTVVVCQGDASYKQIVNHADMATPDGMPLVWLGKLRGHKLVGRTYGPDLMTEMCRVSEKKHHRIYLYGGTPECSEKLEANLLKKFPGLNIVGRFAPPFRSLSEEENNHIIYEMNRVHPDILWVGLGSPKQDFWMYQNRDRLNVPVMVGVGAAFDFLSENKRQAPRWMQKSGLEWFFRLCCEPHRLWKRYLIGNPLFVYLVLKDLFYKRILSKI